MSPLIIRGSRIEYRRKLTGSPSYSGVVLAVEDGWAHVRCDNGALHNVPLDEPESTEVVLVDEKARVAA